MKFIRFLANGILGMCALLGLADFVSAANHISGVGPIASVLSTMIWLAFMFILFSMVFVRYQTGVANHDRAWMLSAAIGFTFAVPVGAILNSGSLSAFLVTYTPGNLIVHAALVLVVSLLSFYTARRLLIPVPKTGSGILTSVRIVVIECVLGGLVAIGILKGFYFSVWAHLVDPEHVSGLAETIVGAVLVPSLTVTVLVLSSPITNHKTRWAILASGPVSFFLAFFTGWLPGIVTGSSRALWFFLCWLLPFTGFFLAVRSRR